MGCVSGHVRALSCREEFTACNVRTYSMHSHGLFFHLAQVFQVRSVFTLHCLQGFMDECGELVVLSQDRTHKQTMCTHTYICTHIRTVHTHTQHRCTHICTRHRCIHLYINWRIGCTEERHTYVAQAYKKAYTCIHTCLLYTSPSPRDS